MSNDSKDNNLLRRYNWAVYLFLLALAIIIFYGHLHWTQDQSIKNLLLNISSELIVITLVFFLVKQFFQIGQDNQKLVEQIKTTLTETPKEVIVYPTRDSLYNSAIAILKGDHWKRIGVFAPVGLWREDPSKAEWLSALAETVETEGVETVRGVFGLPPRRRDGKARSRDEIQQDLRYTKDKLSKFDEMTNVCLHFFPPAEASVGLGIIIFQSKDNSGKVAFALSSHEHEEVVDAAFGIDNDEVFSFVMDWFNDRIFQKSVNAFILQDDVRSFSTRWKDIVTKWYGGDYWDDSLKVEKHNEDVHSN